MGKGNSISDERTAIAVEGRIERARRILLARGRRHTDEVPERRELEGKALEVFEAAKRLVLERTPDLYEEFIGLEIGDYGFDSLASQAEEEGRRLLHVNQQGFAALGPQTACTGLTHELLHFRYHKDNGERLDEEGKILLGAAKDCVINDWLSLQGYQFPPGVGLTGREVIGMFSAFSTSQEVLDVLRYKLSLAEARELAKARKAEYKSLGSHPFPDEGLEFYQ